MKKMALNYVQLESTGAMNWIGTGALDLNQFIASKKTSSQTFLSEIPLAIGLEHAACVQIALNLLLMNNLVLVIRNHKPTLRSYREVFELFWIYLNYLIYHNYIKL